MAEAISMFEGFYRRSPVGREGSCGRLVDLNIVSEPQIDCTLACPADAVAKLPQRTKTALFLRLYASCSNNHIATNRLAGVVCPANQPECWSTTAANINCIARSLRASYELEL